MNVIVDYKAGNLQNLKNALDFLGLPSTIVTAAAPILKADRILLPGVGAFGHAADNLRQSGLLEAILEKVQSGTPLLGICVGMQLLFSQSHEMGVHEGLNLVPGKVVRFDHELKIPQIGWNQTEFLREDPLLQGIESKSYFYFVHSYHGVAESRDNVLATADYGLEFNAIVRKDNVWGVQFHPEKSQNAGLQLLKNFCSL